MVGTATGATTSAGTAPRLVLGGAGGPNDGQVGMSDPSIDTPTGPNDGAGTVADTGPVNGVGMDETEMARPDGDDGTTVNEPAE